MFKYLFSWYLSVFVCVFYVIGHLDLEEGESCLNEAEGINGTCVNARHCLGVFKHIVETRYYETNQICSFKGFDPIVCCTDCELVNDTSQFIYDGSALYYKKVGQKASDKCLEYIIPIFLKDCHLNGARRRKRIQNDYQNCFNYEALDNNTMDQWTIPNSVTTTTTKRPDFIITGGSAFAYASHNAFKREFPEMALLGYGSTLQGAQWLCGGSVISPRFILTAAHCISSPALGPVQFIALGILMRNDTPETLCTVKRIIPHPRYKSPSKYHDIALLETNEKIKFNYVLPLCLYDGSLPRHKVEENKAKATGWGLLGPKKDLAVTLQVVDLTKISDEECAAIYRPNRNLMNGYDPVTQLCYGDKVNSSDTCQGDSGGPLIETTDKGCTRRLIGVTSYGKECGTTNGSAGIYTRVEYYVPWIESIVWP